MNIKTKKITRTAAMLALLIVIQAVTGSMGQLVTGSCVNFILAMSVLSTGIASGITIAVLSPFFAFLFGIGPAFLPIVPAIAAGNAVLVLLLFLFNKNTDSSGIKKIAGILIAALGKFAVLFILVVKLILPILSLNTKQAAVISASFSWPQLITALIGSGLAAFLLPRIRKAVYSHS